MALGCEQARGGLHLRGIYALQAAAQFGLIAIAEAARLQLPHQRGLRAHRIAGVDFRSGHARVYAGKLFIADAVAGNIGNFRFQQLLQLSHIGAVGAMSWRDFSALIEQAYQRDGYAVTRSNGAADFTLVKGNRTVLLCAKRWKAASHGLEPLRELDAARRAQEANEAIYVGAGTVTDNARRFAAANRIRLIEGPELTRLLRLPKSAAKKG